MLFVLFATIALGAGAAGLVLGLRRLTGLPIPRWGAPVAAGITMAAFMLWNEYTWFDRAMATLPEGTRIAETYSYSSWVQPWTVAVPRITRFAVVIPDDRRPGPPLPDLTLAIVLVGERLTGQHTIPHLFDCAARRRAAVSAETWRALAEGTPPDAAALAWADSAADDPLVAAACGTATAQEGDRS